MWQWQWLGGSRHTSIDRKTKKKQRVCTHTYNKLINKQNSQKVAVAGSQSEKLKNIKIQTKLRKKLYILKSFVANVFFFFFFFFFPLYILKPPFTATATATATQK
jgi:hypothetical protein